ncbi:MAG TPA: ribokinase [Microbacterium sp.]|nr:ribokinase [Microbacterium sp.]
MEQQHERAVIVVGSATVDVTAFADRMPARGETILGASFSLALGGKGANQAVATARAGARTFFAACVGDDPFADIVRAGLAEAGVDPRFVREVAGVGTGVAHVRVDGAGDNDIVMIPRANAAMGVDDVDRAIDEQGRPGGVLLTQLETPFDVAIHATARAHACGMTVILDPAPAAPLPDGIWESIDVVTPNETEASAFTGREVVDRASAVKAGRWFVDRGVRTALITLAGSGAVAVTRHGVTDYEPVPVDAIDSTAAGDAFAGYLAAALARGASLDEAIRRATCAGALTVTRTGAAPSIPNASEVEALLG